jgi:hypothetical protein
MQQGQLQQDAQVSKISKIWKIKFKFNKNKKQKHKQKWIYLIACVACIKIIIKNL